MGISGVWNARDTDVDYAWQAFFDALCHAIASTGPLQQRVAAMASSICNLHREQFARDDTWTRFERLLNSVTGEVKDRKAAINVASRAMSEEEARKWLQEAVQVFSDLSEESED